MSGLRYEDLPRILRLTEGVRLQGGLLVVGVSVLRGEVKISSEQMFISVDDASVIHAQLSRLLNEHSFPGLEERREQRSRMQRGW